MKLFENETFDVIICSHVLEHIIDDQKAMEELYRVLKPNGWSILQVPIALNLENILEDPSITTPQGRRKHFGQEDHVRIYNKEGFVGRLLSAGFHVSQFHLAQKYSIEETISLGLSEKDILYIGTKES